MKREVQIRRAIPADLDVLCLLERQSFGVEAFSRRQIAYLIAHAKGLFLVAVREEALAGYVSLLARPHIGNLRLYSIAVVAAARGEGIGQKLLDEMFGYAQKQGFHEISLEVSVANTVAQALYRKNGFTVAERLPAYYHDGGDGWRMKKRI